MICERCGDSHDGDYGSGRFCSSKCARSFSTKHKRKDINRRVSETLRNKYPETVIEKKKKPESKPKSKPNLKSCLSCGKPLCRATMGDLCSTCLVRQGREEKIRRWLHSGGTECQVLSRVPTAIRNYVLDKQNHRCAICGIEETWNNQKLVFVLDHINGDASNSSEPILRYVCPNCDSQLQTFKSKNKVSARRVARKKYTEDMRMESNES